MQNALKSNEWQTLWVSRTFKIEKKKGEPNNSDFLQNWFLPENRSFLLNLKKFQNSDKSSSESYRTLLKANEWRRFWVLKNLKLKYRRGDQIIQIFCRIGSPKKLGPPFLVYGNLKSLRKVLLNQAEYIEI